MQNITLSLMLAAVLLACSSAQAQSTSLFGTGGPASGQVGFGTATTGASFGVGSSAGALSTSAFPGGQIAAGGRRTGGLGLGLGTPGGMTQPHDFFIPRPEEQGGMFAGMGQAAEDLPGSNPNWMQSWYGPVPPVNPWPNGVYVNGTDYAAPPVQTRPTRRVQNLGPIGMYVNGVNQTARPAGQGRQQGPIIQPPVVTFQETRAPLNAPQARVAARFAKLAGRAGLERVSVQSQGGKIILRGQVDSPEASRLATVLAKIEPGVESVVNELRIRRPYE